MERTLPGICQWKEHQEEFANVVLERYVIFG